MLSLHFAVFLGITGLMLVKEVSKKIKKGLKRTEKEYKGQKGSKKEQKGLKKDLNSKIAYDRVDSVRLGACPSSLLVFREFVERRTVASL